MKLSGDFDARCLRGRPQRDWRARLSALVVLLLWLAALTLIGIGAGSLGAVHPALDAPLGVALSLLLAGALLVACALLLGRRARRRRLRGGDLCLAPHLQRRHG